MNTENGLTKQQNLSRQASFGAEENSPINPGSAEEKPKIPWHKKPWFRDVISFLFIVVFVIIPFRVLVAQPYLVTGGSMDPTFQSGEYLIVDQLSYRFEEPKRGDVVIFRYPKDPKEFFIKRIIGLPGETVKLSANGVTITDENDSRGLKLAEPYVIFDKTDTLTITLKNGEYFVMGDNRAASADSRLWGPVPRENIKGKPFVSLFPLSRLDFMPGSLSKFPVQ
ncbi:MAG TPA: signal peptidase I [Candidatus Paceibacterota bacterium]